MKAIIEMPKGSKYKYELKGKKLIIDRVLDIAVPFNYGFIPKTLCDDGDPLDVFVISDEPIVPGTRVTIHPKGVIYCTDNGKQDNKIVATLSESKNISTAEFTSLLSFLTNYKSGFIVSGSMGLNGVKEVVEDAIELYHNCGFND